MGECEYDCMCVCVCVHVCEIDVRDWGRAECVCLKGLPPSMFRPAIGATASQATTNAHVHIVNL